MLIDLSFIIPLEKVKFYEAKCLNRMVYDFQYRRKDNILKL